MRLLLFLLMLALSSCVKKNTCLDYAPPPNYHPTFQWVPYQSSSEIVLHSDSGAIKVLIFTSWSLLPHYYTTTQGDLTCQLTTYDLNASMLSDTVIAMSINADPLNDTQIHVGGHLISIYDDNNYSNDTACELLESIELGGNTYHRVVHCNESSSSGYLKDEVYYSKNEGLIYFRKYGSSQSWHVY